MMTTTTPLVRRRFRNHYDVDAAIAASVDRQSWRRFSIAHRCDDPCLTTVPHVLTATLARKFRHHDISDAKPGDNESLTTFRSLS